MPEPTVEAAARRAELAERLALVAIEMVLTLGAQTGKRFDLRAYADAVSAAPDDDGEQIGRHDVAEVLRRIADSIEAT